MKNTFGNNVSVTLFGESHGKGVGCVIDGLSSGVKVDEEFINKQLSLRRPAGKISTGRVEEDKYEIVSGVFEGYTTGTPICIVIENSNTLSKDYSATRFLARPGHADYTANVKYGGFEDYRGGGHFSGRITTGLVAAGAICKKALETKGIFIGTHLKKCAGVEDRDFENIADDIKVLNDKYFAMLDENCEEEAIKKIEKAREDKDSVGGVLETCVTGMPAGVGEPWFDSLESMLSHALFSIPGLKGVEFGLGFEMADLRGSQVNDNFVVEEGVKTISNNNGGINGGISNGMPLMFRCVLKPTPSIYQKQDTINFKTMENSEIELVGRHDPCIAHRARVVVDSVVAIVLCDMLETTFGENYFRG